MRFKLIIILAVLILVPSAVFAGVKLAACTAADEQSGLLGCVQQASGYEDASASSLSEKVGKIIQVTLSLVGTIFLILMVYAGFLWMTAAGEEEKVTQATNIIKMAIIGLIVIVSAYSITYFVLGAIYKPSPTAPPPGSATNGCCEVCGVLGSNPVTGVLLGAYWLEEGGAGCADRSVADNSVCQQNCNGTVGMCTFESAPCN
ncbi:MAG: pilin [bacterium]|nr:pilin [bacterium]